MRKLKAVWSVEAEQDYRSFYNVESLIFLNFLLEHNVIKESTKEEEVNWTKEGF